jgi:hypothetical protein
VRVCNVRHFEIKLGCVARRNAVVLFEKVDFVASGPACVALVKPRAIDLKYRKAGIPIVMEWTPRTFLRTLAKS